MSFQKMRSNSKVALALFISPSHALYLLYKFWIFYACVMDESLKPTEWPDRYPSAVLSLAINIYYDCDYDYQV